MQAGTFVFTCLMARFEVDTLTRRNLMTLLYGIKSCDTVRKARRWLDERHIHYTFHDLKAQPPTSNTVQAWLAQLAPEQLVNKRSTTWRQLPEADRANLTPEHVITLVQAHPTLIKRPLLEHEGQLTAGFKPATYQSIFHD